MFHPQLTRTISALFSALNLAAGTLLAGPIAITNSGFEADGDVSGPDSISGWTASAATYGVNNATATEAVRSLRLNNPGTLSQLTSETITSGYTYQLSADVGQLAGFSGGKAKLELYGSTSGTIWQSLEISPPSGAWLTDQFVRFDATATHAQGNQTLGIRLLSTSGTELRFDNIRLKRTLDSDFDGIENVFETNTGNYLDPQNTGSHPNNFDTDGDGARDGAEVNMGFDPTDADSRPLRIMCMGDSITVGYTDNPNYLVPFEYGYRSGLYTRLNNAGYKFSFVGLSDQPWFGVPHSYNPPASRDGDPTRGDTVFPKIDLPAVGQHGHRGYGGNGIGAMGASWVTYDKPDVILLMIGINDIKKAGDNPSAALASKVDEILAAKSPSAHLIVAQITPYSGFWQELYNFNVYIRDTLVPTKAAQGHKISTVDLYSLFLTDPGNYASAITSGLHATANHPNNIAYDRMAEAWFQGIEALSLTGPDVIPPSIVSLSPMDGASNAPTGGSLVIVFNEEIQKGTTGDIVIRKTSDQSIVETIPVTSGQVVLSGRNLTIDPSVTLAPSTAYSVQIAAGSVVDDTTPTPNAFAGILDATRWNFTTAAPDTSPPTVSVFSPADNAGGVSLIADLAITFSEKIQKGSGTIELRKTSDNSLVESFPVAASNVSVSGVSAMIDRSVSLEVNTGYHVVIPSGAFKDLSDLSYGGTGAATTWNFTSGTSSIGPVAITNHSFEGGLGGTGPGNVAAGWTWNGSVDWGHAVGNNAGTGPADGSAKHYVIQGNATGNNWELYQITGEVIQAGKTYTLEVDLYAVGGWATTTQGKIQLIARNTQGTINLLAETAGGFDLTAGAWALGRKVEYTATAEQAGKLLGVGLVTSVSNGNLAFDNVRVTASSGSTPDTSAPLLNSRLPADDATGVAANTDLTATFSEVIRLGSGTITLDHLSGGADVVIDVSNHGGQLSVTGAILTINPSPDLAVGASYAVLFSPGSVLDTATVSNAFAGISDPGVWNFTTVLPDTTAPLVSTLSPLDNSNNAAINADLVITFNEAVKKGLGNFIITRTGGSVFETIPATDARISVTGAVVTINPTGTLANNAGYHVEIASGTIEDLAGNDFPGISGTTAWNFTTAAVVSGGPITVTNPSFETGSGTITVDAAGANVAGWTAQLLAGSPLAGRAGSQSSAVTTNGTRQAWINAQSSAQRRLFQMTAATISVGSTYTLTVDAGQSSSFSGSTGLIELYGSSTGTIVRSASLAPSQGGWLMDQTIQFTATDVQAGQTLGIRLQSVGGTQMLFDNVRLTATAPPANTFSSWIGTFGLASIDRDFLDDPDGDLLPNGIEAWFGTHPGEASVGISGITRIGGNMVFSHPRNPSPPDDLTASYEWSPDLSAWYRGDGLEGPSGGPAMTLIADTSGPVTTVTATPSAAMGKVFLRMVIR